MNRDDKDIIFSLLKTASTYVNHYTPEVFCKNPDFSSESVFTEIKVTPLQKSSPTNKQIIPEKVTNSQASEKQIPASKSILSANSGNVPLPENLSALYSKINSCNRCNLCKSRNKVVPGTGSTNPIVLVIGEAPGYEEDMQGLPFVGPAGQLLDKMLAAIQLSRNTNTYICNVVKCRPPQNRNPYPEEAEACSSFLAAQVSFLKPKMILCAGTVAAKNLLKTEMGVTKLRGNFYEYNGIPVAVTYHPSALLRDLSLKAAAWEDLKSFKSRLLQICPDYAGNTL